MGAMPGPHTQEARGSQGCGTFQVFPCAISSYLPRSNPPPPIRPRPPPAMTSKIWTLNLGPGALTPCSAILGQ